MEANSFYSPYVSGFHFHQTVDLHQFCPQEHDAELQEDNVMYLVLLAETKRPTRSSILHSSNRRARSVPSYKARAIPPQAS